MSRRRRKSPILARTLAISVGINIILLPILAHFGAFKKIESSFHEATVVLVKPTDVDEEKDKPKPKEEKKPEPKADKAKGPNVKRNGTPLKANPNAPKVVTAAGSGPASGDGAAIQQGTGKAGEVPNLNPGGGTGASTTAKAPSESTKPVTEAKPDPKPKENPKPAPEPKHTPVYKEPDIAFGPQPTIPEDLQNEALETTFIAEFEVGPDGVPISVTTAKSTGNNELDKVALETARKWRFKPASLDGKGITSKVRLKMEFTVE